MQGIINDKLQTHAAPYIVHEISKLSCFLSFSQHDVSSFIPTCLQASAGFAEKSQVI